MEKPNLVLPLAFSYNERTLSDGTGAAAETLNPLRDQEKVNAYYEPIRNALTGETTLYLTKRPGVEASGLILGGPTQSTYHVVTPPNQAPSDAPWIVLTSSQPGSSTSIRVAGSGFSTYPVTTINQGFMNPRYVDKTTVNNIQTVVIQITDSTLNVTPHSVHYASTVEAWSQISHAPFLALLHRGKMEFMDGFAFQLEASSRIFNSNINTISTWPAANFIKKQIVQDEPVGLAKFKNQILAFGRESVEPFVNAGLSPAPLVPIKHLVERVGLAEVNNDDATHYYSVVGQHIYFCGQPSGAFGSRGAYSYDGSRYERVSTPAIDRLFIARQPLAVGSIYFRGQEAVTFRMSNLYDTTQRWLMFFPRWKDWFEWRSDGFGPANNGFYHIGVRESKNKVYMCFDNRADFGVSTGLWTDQTTTYSEIIRFKIPSQGNHRKQMDYFSVVGNTEVSTTTSILGVAMSDDDWQTTTAVGDIDMTSKSKMLTRLGAYQDRGMILTHNGDTDLRLQYVAAKVRE